MEFKLMKLKDVCDVIDSLHKTPSYEIKGIPMIRVTDLHDGYFSVPKDSKLVSEEVFKEFSKKHIPEFNDILMSRVGTYGLTSIIKTNKKFCLGQNTVIITNFSEKILPEYLFYYLISPYGKRIIEKNVSGSTQKTIRLESINNFDILIPKISDQAKIINVLSKFYKKIEINNKIIGNLEEQAQAIFKSWFVDFEPFQDGNFVESEIGMIPEGWEVKKLDKISKRFNGFSYSSKDISEDSYINMITIKDFNRNGGMPNDAIKPIVMSDRIKDYHFLKENDLIIACTDLTQKADIIGGVILYFPNEKFEKEIFSMDLIKIEPLEYEDTLYLYCYLKNPLFKTFAESATSGTTVLHLSKKAVDDFKLVYPKKENIFKFNGIIKPIVYSQRSLIRENKKLEEIRDSLLPRLMSGEIDLSELDLGGEVLEDE